jgi:hypothetical protein
VLLPWYVLVCIQSIEISLNRLKPTIEAVAQPIESPLNETQDSLLALILVANLRTHGMFLVHSRIASSFPAPQELGRNRG